VSIHFVASIMCDRSRLGCQRRFHKSLEAGGFGRGPVHPDVIQALAEEAGWIRYENQDVCPECQKSLPRGYVADAMASARR
jgi:hypothetical protein